MRLDALVTLAFAGAPPLNGLTLPHTVSRRFIMQKARGQTGQVGTVTVWLPRLRRGL